MLFINKSRWKFKHKMLFGLAQLSDGLIRLITLGFVCTTFPSTVSRNCTKAMIEETYKKRVRDEQN